MTSSHFAGPTTCVVEEHETAVATMEPTATMWFFLEHARCQGEIKNRPAFGQKELANLAMLPTLTTLAVMPCTLLHHWSRDRPAIGTPLSATWWKGIKYL